MNCFEAILIVCMNRQKNDFYRSWINEIRFPVREYRQMQEAGALSRVCRANHTQELVLTIINEIESVCHLLSSGDVRNMNSCPFPSICLE